jgi:hypothetical protein
MENNKKNKTLFNKFIENENSPLIIMTLYCLAVAIAMTYGFISKIHHDYLIETAEKQKQCLSLTLSDINNINEE